MKTTDLELSEIREETEARDGLATFPLGDREEAPCSSRRPRMTIDVELVLDAGADLGEGPTWDPRTGVLTWVDITPGLVHRVDPATGRDEALHVGRPVGTAVPTTSGRLALAASEGLALLDPATGRVEPSARSRPATRGPG